FDYGEGGVLASIEHLDAVGIVHAGIGRNLAEARMPGFLETKSGRVGLVAATATFRPWNRAGAQRPDLHGRPGINPLSFANTYTVDGKTFDALKRLNRELGFDQTRLRNRGHFYSDAEAPTERTEELEVFGERVVRGQQFDATTAVGLTDMEDNLRMI